MMTFYNPPTRFFSKNTIKLCKGVSIAGSQPTKGYMFFGSIEKYILPYHCLVSIQHRVATQSHREVIACYSPWVGPSVKFQIFFRQKRSHPKGSPVSLQDTIWPRRCCRVFPLVPWRARRAVSWLRR